MVVASREAQVVEGDLVDGEDGAGGPVLWRHVADGGPVGQRHGGHAGAVELDELPHHAVLSEEMGDGQHQIRGGGAGRLLAGEAETHDRGEEHGERLTEHGRLGLDATDAPSEDAEPVDHGGVGVGADQGVAVCLSVVGGEHHPRQVLEVDLVTDAGAGRDHPISVERLLGPAEELIALDIPLVLDVDVLVEGPRAPRRLGDDRVIDDQLDRDERVDPARVAAQRAQRVAHGRQIDHAGHAGEVLHEDPLGGEGDLRGVLCSEAVALGAVAPSGHRFDVGGTYGESVLVAQEVLEHHLDRVREPGDVVAAGQRVDPVDLVGGVADGQGAAGAEGVG